MFAEMIISNYRWTEVFLHVNDSERSILPE